MCYPGYVMKRAGLVAIALFTISPLGFSAPANSPVMLQSDAATASQSEASSKPAPSPETGQGKAATDPGAALDFLGSYSAPQAVLATETGHTSARPPSATTDQRLTELSSDLGRVPVAPAELRDWLAGMLATPDHSPEDWFRIGTAALEGARADSRRLGEVAPSSTWNQRLEAEALASRYPALARSLWDGKGQPPVPATAAKSGGRPTISLVEAHTELDRIGNLPESPENLYTRARLLLGVSEQAFVRAAASPQLDARLYALQALAAEDANDEGGALKEYQSGLAKYPESALLHAGLGHLNRERNDLEPARSQLEQAWRLDPTDALVGFELGDVELRMGKAGDAVEMLNRALGLDPNLLVARWARGRAYLQAGGAGNDQRALEDLTAAESCDRTGVLEWQIAQVEARLGRTAEAAEHRRLSEAQRRALAESKGPAVPRQD
ncbi:MAG TPA: hypothetical protein VGZ29_06475 [Terriglobia bacterium]|nr:hypothetical protein [Terriglobia bacterium]